jgi:DNA-binding transcriptional LysR family regulator
MQDVTTDDLDAMATAGARVLGIAVEPEWRAAILANLRVSLTLGLLVASFDLPDEAESASVFRA